MRHDHKDMRAIKLTRRKPSCTRWGQGQTTGNNDTSVALMGAARGDNGGGESPMDPISNRTLDDYYKSLLSGVTKWN